MKSFQLRANIDTRIIDEGSVSGVTCERSNPKYRVLMPNKLEKNCDLVTKNANNA